MKTRSCRPIGAISVLSLVLASCSNPSSEPAGKAASPTPSSQPSTVAGAGQPNEPLGGQPPAGSKTSVEDFDYQIKYHRAFEAVLWNMPAVAIYSFRRAAFDDLGAKDNDIIAYSTTATPKLEAITANSTTP